MKFEMFWKYNSTNSTEVDTLLAKDDITLQEVMDSDDIINQCKAQNKALIEFFVKPDVMDELVTLTTSEPSIELDELIRFKYPNIACELLTSDVPAINERLASDEMLLDKLYGFLESEPPLNPLLASYFSKIMGALIAKKTEQVLDFLKAKDTFISLLLKHLGTSAIMDLMLKLMTQIESVEMKQNILNWLDSQRIIQSLLCILSSPVDKHKHDNVAQLLCDFIRVARETVKNSTERVDPDPLLNTIESVDTIGFMLDKIFFEREKCESAILGGIQVLLALLDLNHSSIPKNNSQNNYNSNLNDEANDIENREITVQAGAVQSITEHLKDFHDLLLNPPKKKGIPSTVGMLDPPLGNLRLQIAKLFAVCLTTGDANFREEICSMGSFPVLMDLFFQYPWNNFLHTQVEHCLISGLKGHPSIQIQPCSSSTADELETQEFSIALSRHLLVNCSIIERILKAWQDNDEQQKESKNLRQGYMGHLISIVNKIVELCSSTGLGLYLQETLPDVAKMLDEFKDSTLKDTIAVQDSLLGGAYPNTSNDDTDDYNDMAFPQDQFFQMYSTYQMQHLTSNSIDGYSGFNDDAFNDGDDTLQTIDHRTDMMFNLSDGDLAQTHELFKQICAQSVNALDDADDQIFEDRDHTFQTVIKKEDQEALYSSDSDDESSPPGVPMEVDPWLSPKPNEVPILAEDPWATAQKTDANINSSDWADFSSASFEANFDDSFGKSSDSESKSIKCVVENDLKVENIEIEPKKPEEPKPSVENLNNVAQESKEEIPSDEPEKDSAGGDQCENGPTADEDATPLTEPSNSPSSTDGDQCSPKETPITTDKDV